MINTNLNTLSKHVHEYVKSKGFWKKPRTITELLCLVHGEVDEAVEEIRNGHTPTDIYYSGKREIMNDVGHSFSHNATAPKQGHIVGGVGCYKPEGVPSELIDIIFRVCDIAGFYGIDLDAMAKLKMDFNETRPMMHGDKKL